jgi:Fur family ferric uptake transcriptional regulator
MDDNTVSSVIRTAGFRATRPRIDFLRTVVDAAMPLSVADIAVRMSKHADLVTAYRIADSFEKAGLLTRVELRAGKAHYEFAHRSHHHHIVCTDCGTVEDVDVCVPATITRSVKRSSKQFNQINAHALEFFGTCTSCTYA